jgi:hypothetical protein
VEDRERKGKRGTKAWSGGEGSSVGRQVLKRIV